MYNSAASGTAAENAFLNHQLTDTMFDDISGLKEKLAEKAKQKLIQSLQKKAGEFLSKNCPEFLQAPLAQLLSDEVALSSLMSYIYELAAGETSFSMGALQQLPMKPATRKILSTPGLIKHIFTSIQPLLSSLPGKLSLPVLKDESPQKKSKQTDVVTRRSKCSEKSYPTDSDAPLCNADAAGKISLFPALAAGGLTLSGLLSTFYSLYYCICYDKSVALSISSILGYLVLGVGVVLAFKWILKPCLSRRDKNVPLEKETLRPQDEDRVVDATERREYIGKIITIVFGIVVLLFGVCDLNFYDGPVMFGSVMTMIGLYLISLPWWADKMSEDGPAIGCLIGMLVLGTLGVFAYCFDLVDIELWEVVTVYILGIVVYLTRNKF